MDICETYEKLCTEDFFQKEDLHHIVQQTTSQAFEIIDTQVRPASEDGPKGFLGEHYKMTITVKENDAFRKIHLFIKTLPRMNKIKCDFIVKTLFFKRESLMFDLLDEMREVGGPNSWYIKPFIHNDKMLVSPDLSVEGYQLYPERRYLDKDHVFIALATIAKFHAAFANYETKKKSIDCGYDFLVKHGDIVAEPSMCFGDTLWIRTGAKLTNNFLREFSSEFFLYPADLEAKLCELYITGSDTLKEYEDTLNVIVHRDLWANNLMFKYKGDEVENAILLDFQCIRYGPPAFDVMSMLYLTTSRDLRDRYETACLRHHYSVFIENVDEETKCRIKNLNYDEDSFLIWCAKARKFGMLAAIMIFPCILMDSDAVKKTFDNPDKFVEYIESDRSAPIISHARENSNYRTRLLEISEEFVERFITD